jgi:hypothetical protein
MRRDEQQRKLKKRNDAAKRFHKGRDALDESLFKARGVLMLMMDMGNQGLTENPDALQGAIWILDDELERLDEEISSLFLSLE